MKYSECWPVDIQFAPRVLGQEIKEMEDEPTEDWKAEVPRSAPCSGWKIVDERQRVELGIWRSLWHCLLNILLEGSFGNCRVKRMTNGRFVDKMYHELS